MQHEQPHSVPVERLLAQWHDLDRAGRLTWACPHIGPSPHIVTGLLHQPGRLRCVHCGIRAAHLDGQARPNECDACGRYATRFSEVTVALGPAMLSANVCRRCRPPEDDQTLERVGAVMYANQDGTRTTAVPHLTATCPSCDHPVVAKCGSIVTWHWAHQARADCDPWAEPDSEWHHRWQDAAPPHQREVIIGNHRADIVTGDGAVVELQHSTISPEEIAEREAHYGRMWWTSTPPPPTQRGGSRCVAATGTTRSGGSTRVRLSAGASGRCCSTSTGSSCCRSARSTTSGRCGGWGQLVPANQVRAWLGRPSQEERPA